MTAKNLNTSFLRLYSGQAFKLIIAIGVSLGAGVIGSFFMASAVQSSWYAGLVKPALNPPASVFGPVWAELFALMGVSLFLVWSFSFSQDKKQYSDVLQNVGMLRARRWAIALFFYPAGLEYALVDYLFWFAQSRRRAH